MPEPIVTTDKDRAAIIAFARAVQEAQERGVTETPDQRTQRHLEAAKALPRAPGFESPEERTQRFLKKSQDRPASTFSAPVSNRIVVNAPGPLHEAASEWGARKGTEAGEYLKANLSQDTQKSIRDTARKALDAIHATRAAQPEVAVVQSYGDLLNPHRRQDEELKALERQKAEARRQLSATDLGELDENVDEQDRNPTMVREFSNEAEKAAYLENLRKAQNSGGK